MIKVYVLRLPNSNCMNVFHALLLVGHQPIFVDVDKDTMGLSPSKLKSFLENLLYKHPKKEKYIDWELSLWFPNFKKNIDQLINELKTFEYQGYWPGANGDESKYQIFFSRYNNKNVLSILRKFVLNNINDYLVLKNKSFFVEDNTWNILYAYELYKLFPQSKLIHVVRDPRDVISSFMQQRWCPNEFEKSLEMYLSILERWFHIEKKLPKSFYKIVKIEDVVSDRKYVLNEICDFLNVPFSNDLMNIELNKLNQHRWKKTFTDEQIIKLEKRLINVFNKLNYKL